MTPVAGPPGTGPQGREPRHWTTRDKLIVAGFLLFAVLVGVAFGYMVYWARQEAVAEFIDEQQREEMLREITRRRSADGRLDVGVDELGEALDEREDDLAVEGEPEEEPRPRIAIVIDDWGYDWAAAQAFLEFPERLTVAVLPFLPFSVSQAEQALAAGHEVIVHMPMEPQNSAIDIGPGGVYVSMDEDAVAEAVVAALSAVPGAVGLNNHMGSRATTEPNIMRTVMRVLQEQNKFFLDSYTTAATVGPTVAREMGLPHAVNQVFLDHEDDEEHIRGQIRRLANLAKERGVAIGIGHVRPRTYSALVDMLPELQAEGFEFVTVSQVLNVPLAVGAAAEEDEVETGDLIEEAEPVRGRPFVGGPSRPDDALVLKSVFTAE